MRRARGLGAALVVGLALTGAAITAAPAAESGPAPEGRFRTVAVTLTADAPVAAYEVELSVVAGESAMVGVEGGEAPLDEPPYYDPRALEGGRIVLAGFDTRASLPPGTHRVAVVHVAESTPEVTYRARVRVAVDPDGQAVEAEANVVAQSGEGGTL